MKTWSFLRVLVPYLPLNYSDCLLEFCTVMISFQAMWRLIRSFPLFLFAGNQIFSHNYIASPVCLCICLSIYPLIIYHLFWGSFSLNCPGWPQTWDSSTSASLGAEPTIVCHDTGLAVSMKWKDIPIKYLRFYRRDDHGGDIGVIIARSECPWSKWLRDPSAVVVRVSFLGFSRGEWLGGVG